MVLGVTGHEFDELVKKDLIKPVFVDGKKMYEEQRLTKAREYIRKSQNSKNVTGFTLLDAVLDAGFSEGLERAFSSVLDSIFD